jgi:hypothetical protein
MEEAGALYSIAEVSIGLAGFTGVVTALQGRGVWHQLDIWRVVNLLIVTFGTLFLALTPIALHSYGIHAPALWRASSAFAIACALLGSVVLVCFQPQGTPIRARFLLIPIIVVSLQALNALAVLTRRTFAVYYTCLVLSLVVGAIEFVQILLVRPEK